MNELNVTSSNISMELNQEAVVTDEALSSDMTGSEDLIENSDADLGGETEGMEAAPEAGEMLTDENIASDEAGIALDGSVEVGKDVYIDMPVFGDEMTGDMTEGMEVKDPLLSSWPFVIGVSSAVLVVSILLGVLLARRKIKKGIEIYED